jgi:rhamnose utilization protein RhaD (predicted bifunctional aldolase and dehydrogenase)
LIDTAPRILLDPIVGVCAFAASKSTAQIALDMYRHDITVMSRASAHDRYRAAPAAAMAQAEFEYGGYMARLHHTAP